MRARGSTVLIKYGLPSEAGATGESRCMRCVSVLALFIGWRKTCYCLIRLQAQYAPDPPQIAPTVFAAIAKSLSIDQFST